MTTDEVYLIRAECLARLGQKDAALADLNILMKKRWRNTVTYPIIVAADATEALNRILVERRKELLRRGLRWTDLRRLNKEPQYAVTITRVVNGITYTLEPNSYKDTFPIPDDIIAATGMQQNTGW